MPDLGLSDMPGNMPHLDAHGYPLLEDVLPTNGTRLRWAIAGPGRIAHDFATALVAMGATVQGVAAGGLPHAVERARAFSMLYNIPRAYGSYAELAADPDVDVVYVATTNQLHYTAARIMLEGGKHVLLEKPATIGVAQFEHLARLSRERELLLVTNYWTRWFPAVKWAEAIVKSGMLGPVVHVSGDMAFQVMRAAPDRDRFLRADLGGGAVLDMGCYLVQFAAMFLEGNTSVGPSGYTSFEVKASGTVRSGVDVEAAFIMSNGRAGAAFGTSITRASDFALKVYCEHGVVEIKPPANCPSAASYIRYEDSAVGETPVPCCAQPLVSSYEFYRPLPVVPRGLPMERYPNGMGFVCAAGTPARPPDSNLECTLCACSVKPTALELTSRVCLP